MTDVRLTLVYYSTYGLNHQMATVAAQAAREAGVEVRLRKAPETAPADVVAGQEAWQAHLDATADVPEATPDDMEWADAYLFSTPTRFGVAASQMRAFIDTLGPLWQQGTLADKPITAMTSAMNPHGGQEATLHSLYVTFMHWGSIIVTPGYTGDAVFGAGGNPYGTSVTAYGSGVDDAALAAIQHQTRRLIELTRQVVQGRRAREGVAAN
ncbi:MAG: NAD(P)H:quinone oxidoreductase [Trueperaceae bacterium]|nr:NAD(P)H:quinone oxidoreductase [Trueperaceae bacterium]